jgi:hypothetical protein
MTKRTEVIQSLRGVSVAPLCGDHQPIADYNEEVGLVVVYCDNCGFRMHMSLETFAELERGDDDKTN